MNLPTDSLDSFLSFVFSMAYVMWGFVIGRFWPRKRKDRRAPHGYTSGRPWRFIDEGEE